MKRTVSLLGAGIVVGGIVGGVAGIVAAGSGRRAEMASVREVVRKERALRREAEEALSGKAGEVERLRRRIASLAEEVERLSEENRNLEATGRSLREESAILWKRDAEQSERLQQRFEDIAELHRELDAAAEHRIEEVRGRRDAVSTLEAEMRTLRERLAAADLQLQRAAEMESRLRSLQALAEVLLTARRGVVRDDLALLRVLADFYRGRGRGEMLELVEKLIEKAGNLREGGGAAELEKKTSPGKLPDGGS